MKLNYMKLNFMSLIKNKNIAFVGPVILDSNMYVNIIDNRDVVIRLNKYNKLNKSLYGKKVNIVYYNGCQVRYSSGLQCIKHVKPNCIYKKLNRNHNNIINESINEKIITCIDNIFNRIYTHRYILNRFRKEVFLS